MSRRTECNLTLSFLSRPSEERSRIKRDPKWQSLVSRRVGRSNLSHFASFVLAFSPYFSLRNLYIVSHFLSLTEIVDANVISPLIQLESSQSDGIWRATLDLSSSRVHASTKTVSSVALMSICGQGEDRARNDVPSVSNVDERECDRDDKASVADPP